jgi:hemerythrin-like domain-containing protein
MFALFKKKRRVEPTKNTPSPNLKLAKDNNGISYDENLIKDFKQEHQELLRLFSIIKSAAEQEDIKLVQTKLKRFTSILRGHLLTENVKLYVYLTKELANDIENKDIIMSFRREMMQIGKVVNQFVTRYDKKDWSSDMQQHFLPELLAIGEVLVERIEREENTLYPLYLPKEHYASY